MGNIHEIGFTKSFNKVDKLISQEVKYLSPELKEKTIGLENFIANLTSHAFADGYEFRDEEIKKVLKEVM